MATFAEARTRLRTIPGVGVQAAGVIVAEIGTDADEVPRLGHLASWAGDEPRPRRERGQRRDEADDQGEPVAADDVGASGVGGQPHQGDDLRRDVPPPGRNGWERRRWWR